MVAPMKTRGMSLVVDLLRRNRRLYALGRIGTEDFRYIEQRLKEVQARIISMREHNTEEDF